jgi:hypothetical protein
VRNVKNNDPSLIEPMLARVRHGGSVAQRKRPNR